MGLKLGMLWALLFGALWGQAQERVSLAEVLQKSCRVCGELKTLTADLLVDLGSPEPGVEMSIGQNTGHVRMKRAAAEDAVGWYLANEIYTRNYGQGYRVWYGGDSLTYLLLPDSLVEREGRERGASEWGMATWREMTEKVADYHARLTLPDSAFDQRENAWLVGEITWGRDTVIDGRACWRVENRKSGERTKQKSRYDKTEWVAIDKGLYLPVACFSHFHREVDGVAQIDQKTWHQFTRVRVNEPLEDSIFRFRPQGKRSGQQALKELKEGDIAPDWTLADVSGDSVSLHALRKEYILLDFGHIACGACVLAVGDIERNVWKHCDREKVAFLYIDLLDSEETMRKYAAEKGVDYPFLKGNKELEELYGVTGYPRLFLLDGNFRVVKVFPGYFDGLGAAIRKYLEQ